MNIIRLILLLTMLVLFTLEGLRPEMGSTTRTILALLWGAQTLSFWNDIKVFKALQKK